MIQLIGDGQQAKIVKYICGDHEHFEECYHIAIGDTQMRKHVHLKSVPKGALYCCVDMRNRTAHHYMPNMNRPHYRGEHSHISESAQIGFCVYVNTGAIIEHDCTIADFVNINPGAILCGSVKVGECTTIGAGAIIREGITIGSNVIIGAGAVVVKDVPDNETWVGNPVRPLKST